VIHLGLGIRSKSRSATSCIHRYTVNSCQAKVAGGKNSESAFIQFEDHMFRFRKMGPARCSCFDTSARAVRPVRPGLSKGEPKSTVPFLDEHGSYNEECNRPHDRSTQRCQCYWLRAPPSRAPPFRAPHSPRSVCFGGDMSRPMNGHGSTATAASMKNPPGIARGGFA
jgi:hypothetical protein